MSHGGHLGQALTRCVTTCDIARHKGPVAGMRRGVRPGQCGVFDAPGHGAVGDGLHGAASRCPDTREGTGSGQRHDEGRYWGLSVLPVGTLQVHAIEPVPSVGESASMAVVPIALLA